MGPQITPPLTNPRPTLVKFASAGTEFIRGPLVLYGADISQKIYNVSVFLGIVHNDDSDLDINEEMATLGIALGQTLQLSYSHNYSPWIPVTPIYVRSGEKLAIKCVEFTDDFNVALYMKKL